MPYKKDRNYAIQKVRITREQYEVIDIENNTVETAKQIKRIMERPDKVISSGSKKREVLEELRLLTEMEARLYSSAAYYESNEEDEDDD